MGFGHSYLCHYHIINLLHYYPVQAYNPPTTFSAPTKPCLNVRVEGEATLSGLTSGVCRSISGRNHACTIRTGCRLYTYVATSTSLRLTITWSYSKLIELRWAASSDRWVAWRSAQRPCRRAKIAPGEWVLLSFMKYTKQRCNFLDTVIVFILELKQISGSTGYPFLFYYPDIQNKLTGYCEWLDDIHWRS